MKKESVIRQDRIISSEQNWVLNFNGVHCNITNYSIFGIACVSKLQISEPVWNGCSITQNSLFKIENLSFKVVREARVGDHYEYGLETVVDTLPVTTMQDIVSISNFVSDLDKSLTLVKTQIPERARLLVLEFKSALDEVEDFLATNEKETSYNNFSDKKAFEDNTISIIGTWLATLLNKCNRELDGLTKGLKSDDLNLCLKFYRDNLRDNLYQSVFAHRCLNKPLGYAGDYEMMNLLYRNEDFGNTLFARCVEYAVQKNPEPEAVRNRAEYLCTKLQEQLKKKPDSTIISIASGPSYEIQLLLERSDEKLLKDAKFILLDQDLAALKNAQFNIKAAAKRKGVSIHVELMDLSIKRVITAGLGGRSFDMIYSAGLFDYFTDEVARLAARRLIDATNVGGTVIIGNFDIHSPNKFGMKLVFDWDLIYRSEENLLKLYEFPNVKNRIEHEKTKINLFCILAKE